MAVLIDFESIVAKCTLEIEELEKANVANANNDDIAQKYVERAYARLLSGQGIDTSIEDCSRALNLSPPLSKQKSFAYAIRAYAYFINNNYIQALDDCKLFKNIFKKIPKKQRKPKIKRFVKELWCLILQKKQKHKDALNQIRIYFTNGCLNAPDFLLCEQYRELREQLKKGW
jgi:tetratricopeptide (TPR) repeat protein